jgi:CheY-like chemotaxis protein
VGRGTGLGLSTVYSTVQAHHGRIEMQSAPGRGTCVQVRFPAFRTGEVQKAPARAAGAAAGRRLRVLVIDDDELIQASMEMLLQSLGHSAVPAPGGERGLALLQEGAAPDLVILDMNMPDLNGAETLARLRIRHPDLPVLLATGRVDQAALDLVRADGHTLLLPKPFARAELVERMEAALKRD